MKIIEAMKKVKANKEKIQDLKHKISQHCAHLSHETPMYPDAKEKVAAWAQSCEDLGQENIRLLCAIAKTNLATEVSIEMGEKLVTKKIAEWIWRRREYAKSDLEVYSVVSDRNLREGTITSSTGVPIEVKLVRNYDPVMRDAKINLYRYEAKLIDSKLEVINAVTELME